MKRKPNEVTFLESSNIGDTGLLTESDHESIESFLSYFNQPLQLLWISLPSLLTMALCPATLFLYKPMINLFWPPEIYPTPPAINGVIGSFLTPAGLVYAIAFGFAFQEAMSKQNLITTKLASILTLLNHIVMMTSLAEEIKPLQKQQIIHALKEEVVCLMRKIMHKPNANPPPDSLNGV